MKDKEGRDGSVSAARRMHFDKPNNRIEGGRLEPPMELTEERVREIAREEIDRHEREGSHKFRVDIAEGIEDWAKRPPFAWMDAEGADAATSD